MIVLRDVLALLDAELLTAEVPLDLECPAVFASDLMSDVLSSAEPGSLLLTGLTNNHVVSTCSVADLAAVVFVQGKRPNREVVSEAGAQGLPLLTTPLTMFEACSRIAAFMEGRRRGR